MQTSKAKAISKCIGGEGLICGRMICDACGKKIKNDVDYLIVNHYVSKRGNEDDFTKIYHKKCSKNDPTWAHYAEQTSLIESLEATKLKAIEMIKIAEYVDIDGRTIHLEE